MAEHEQHSREEEQIRERIEERRARMGETIEEIGAHLNPEHLKYEFKAGMREQVEQSKREIRDATIGRAGTLINNVEGTVNRTTRTLIDTIRDNPVPAAMAGIGLGWLIADARKHEMPDYEYDNEDRYRYGREGGGGGVSSTAPGYLGPRGYTARPPSETEMAGGGARTWRDAAAEKEGLLDRARHATAGAADEVQDRASEMVRDVQGRASEMADDVRDTVSDAAQGARERASELAHRAQDTVEDVWHDVEYQARHARHRAERLTEENPLAAGAVALALGFAAGMMIPESRQERRLMGPTRERLMERAQEATSRAVEKAGRIVETAAEESREGAERGAHQQDLMGDR
jgi:ElaB/YqjD/DUF883 family membrane-anchored ribosome-binding protein